jgi:hypothetical protein
MLYIKVKNSKNIPENAIGSANIVKFYVYIPGYADCLLAGSGWNWFSCVAGGVLTSWSHGK